MAIFMYSTVKLGRQIVTIVIASVSPIRNPYQIYEISSPLLTRNPLQLSSSLPSSSSLSSSSLFNMFSRPFSKKRESNADADEVPCYPVIQNFAMEKLNPDLFGSKVKEILDMFPDKFRGFRILPPILNKFCQIGFETKTSNVLALYSCFNFLPVAVVPREGDYIFVLSAEDWKNVHIDFKKGRKIFEMEHSYDIVAMDYSVRELVQSVDIVASPLKIDGVLVKAAISRLIVMVSYSCFCTEFLEFFQYVFDDGVVKVEVGSDGLVELWEESIQLYDTLVGLSKIWDTLSKDVYDSKEQFVVNGNVLYLEQLRKIFTLAISREEDRCIVVVDHCKARAYCGSLLLSNVCSLRKDVRCKNLIVKVLSVGKVLYEDGRSVVSGEVCSIPNLRMSEFLVGDSTGCIVFIARNEQVDILKFGLVVMLKNARTEFYQRLCLSVKAGDGRIEVVDYRGGDFLVKERVIY